MAYTQDKTGIRSNANPGPLYSVQGASTLASSASINFEYDLGMTYSNFGLQVRSDTTTAHKVILQGSIAGGSSDWFTLGSTWVGGGSTAQSNILWMTSKPVTFIRAKVTDVVSSSSDPNLRAWIAPAL